MVQLAVTAGMSPAHESAHQIHLLGCCGVSFRGQYAQDLHPAQTATLKQHRARQESKLPCHVTSVSDHCFAGSVVITWQPLLLLLVAVPMPSPPAVLLPLTALEMPGFSGPLGQQGVSCTCAVTTAAPAGDAAGYTTHCGHWWCG